MPLIIPANTLAVTGFSVANSCRFNRGDEAVFSQTQSTSPTHDDKATVSLWFKPGRIDIDGSGFGFSGGDDASNRFSATLGHAYGDNGFYLYGKVGGSQNLNLNGNRALRDPSSWYHLIVAVDTTQGVAASRVRVYINNVEITSWATTTYPSQNDDCMLVKGGTFDLGCIRGGSWQQYNFTDGYMAEAVLIDGQQLTPSSFGEYDEDSPTIWKPKDVSGLTFGTNGFYLDFADSSALGNDVSGNNNDFTATNLAAVDQATDTPSNNFCTMNPLDNYYAAGTFSQGNCKVVTNASNTTWGTSTFGLSSGKWYFEIKFEGTLGGGENAGIIDRPTSSTSASPYNGSSAKNAVWRSGGHLYIDDTNDTDFTPSGGDLWVSNDILGVFLDLDNNKIYCAVNGTIAISGTGVDITAVASTLNNAYFIIAGDSNTASTNFEFNFGGCSAFDISSGNADANGYGNFEYSPNQGGASNFDSAAKNFLAICSKNLGSDGG